MTEYEKDYKYNKARAWFDRPAYYIDGREVVGQEHIGTVLRPAGGSEGLTEKNRETERAD